MKKPFKLKYKNSAFPFKKDEKEITDTIESPPAESEYAEKDYNKEILDIRKKLDYTNKSEIPNEELQKAYFEQQKREQNWKKIDNRLERKRMDIDDSYPDPNELG